MVIEWDDIDTCDGEPIPPNDRYLAYFLPK